MPERRMSVVEDGKAIKCHTCGMVSWSPGDIKNGYCGNCHLFADQVRRGTRVRPPKEWAKRDGGSWPPPRPTRIQILMEES